MGCATAIFTPPNVIMTADGPKLVDWTGTMRAAPAHDFAVSHFMLTEVDLELADDPERPRAVNAAMAGRNTQRLAGLSQAALRAAMECYLPIVFDSRSSSAACCRSSGSGSFQRVEAALCSGSDGAAWSPALLAGQGQLPADAAAIKPSPAGHSVVRKQRSAGHITLSSHPSADAAGPPALRRLLRLEHGGGGAGSPSSSPLPGAAPSSSVGIASSPPSPHLMGSFALPPPGCRSPAF